LLQFTVDGHGGLLIILVSILIDRKNEPVGNGTPRIDSLITRRHFSIIFAVKIWIAKDSEISVREQLIAQIRLGIAAGDFGVGEKLPSTREIARRCGVHANTVGTVYRKLVEQQHLEFRKGSGFYVAHTTGTRIEGSRRLDELINSFLEASRGLGFSESEVIKRMTEDRGSKSTDSVMLIEPNEALRDILIHELSAASIPVAVIDVEALAEGRLPGTPLVTAMSNEKPKIEEHLKAGQKCVYLHGRSVAAAMSEEERPSKNKIIAIVSGWEGFLTFARIMLLAAKIDPGNLVVRSTLSEDWERATRFASLIICDSLTAERLDGRTGVRTFRIVSEQSLTELKTELHRISPS